MRGPTLFPIKKIDRDGRSKRDREREGAEVDKEEEEEENKKKRLRIQYYGHHKVVESGVITGASLHA